ncbi:hypothetical protein [Nonomuraea pusilla]|uniref:hypothetical protein n=1 Tax=Nonomuraea pusilla TaxID=46177 RepID=UPI0011602358|nr:hypothetical protein [Nonomuraea pusilla]
MTAVGACAVSAAAFSAMGPRVVLVAAAVGLFGAWAGSDVGAVLTGLMAWCFATGFLVHTGGELAFERPDLDRLGVFLVVAVAGSVLGHLRRLCRARRGRRRLMRARGDVRRAPVLAGRVHPPQPR